MDQPIQSLIERGALSPPVSADVRFPVSVVVRMLNEQGSDSALIYDGPDLVGIFTERDVLTRIVERRKDPELTEVGEVMTIAPYTIGASDSLEDALRLMRETRVAHLPVVREHAAVAVIAERDIMASHAEQLAHENRVLSRLVYGVSPQAMAP